VLDELWITLSKSDTPETKAEFDKQLKLLNELLAELKALVPALKISEIQDYGKDRPTLEVSK
jgi:hypothetical protein